MMTGKVDIPNMLVLSLKSYILFSLLFFLGFNNYAQDDIQRKMNVGLSLQEAYEVEGYTDVYLFNKAENLFKDVLEQESSNTDALYSLSALYYNRAVHLINVIKKGSLDESQVEECEAEVKRLMDKYEPLSNKYNKLKEK